MIASMQNYLMSKEAMEYQKMLEHITSISLSKNIWEEKDIIAVEKKRYYGERMDLSEGKISPFKQTRMMNIPLLIQTPEGAIDIECRIWARTMQSFINEDIVSNIRSAGKLELLDIDFEFGVWITDFSEYDFGDKLFYKNIKKSAIQYIKDHPLLQQAIVDNYCDGIDATLWYLRGKEPLINKWESASRELFRAFGMPKSYVLAENEKYAGEWFIYGIIGANIPHGITKRQKRKIETLRLIGNAFGWFDSGNDTRRYVESLNQGDENINKMMLAIEAGNKEISLDSKYFFLDGGDNLYDDIIEKSKYNEYYLQELKLIKDNKQKIDAYLRRRYIGLWCGNGKKDYSMLKDKINTAGTSRATWAPVAVCDPDMVSIVLFMDSSLRSLSKAEKLVSGWYGARWPSGSGTTVLFSTERIDTLLKNNEIKTLTSVTNRPKDAKLNIPDIREASNTFSLFGGTFGNFGDYQTLFLQNMGEIMNQDDVLCISLFNPPKTKEARDRVVQIYDTPETHMFLKNLFIKLGIQEDAIEINISYDGDKTITMDAIINQKDNQPVYMCSWGRKVQVPNGTKFNCINSQRIGQEDLQDILKKSETSLEIKESITTPDNPFTMYMISKKKA